MRDGDRQLHLGRDDRDNLLSDDVHVEPETESGLSIGLGRAQANMVGQFIQELQRDGFALKIMAVGESGLGKSTLLDTLFRTDIEARSEGKERPKLNAKTVRIERRDCVISEGGMDLNLTIIDTPGYGDAINNEDAWEPIIDYIMSELEVHLDQEQDLTLRGKKTDTRVHAVLYFMAPHRLKDVDVAFMERLHTRVNLIPVIAKADTMTTGELAEYKVLIMETLEKRAIRCYPKFPQGRMREYVRALLARETPAGESIDLPPGPVGILLKDGSTTVHSVLPTSPLVGKLSAGDKIIGIKQPFSVRNVDTSQMTDTQLGDLFAACSAQPGRRITVVRGAAAAMSASAQDVTEAARLTPPFAVIGSNESFVLEAGLPHVKIKPGTRAGGRTYPWGRACIEDPSHCDIIKLRRTVIDDIAHLRDATEEIYQDFRCNELAGRRVKKKTGFQRACDFAGFLLVKFIFSTLLFIYPLPCAYLIGTLMLLSLCVCVVVFVRLVRDVKFRDSMSMQFPALVTAARFFSCSLISDTRYERKRSFVAFAGTSKSHSSSPFFDLVKGACVKPRDGQDP